MFSTQSLVYHRLQKCQPFTLSRFMSESTINKFYKKIDRITHFKSKSMLLSVKFMLLTFFYTLDLFLTFKINYILKNVSNWHNKFGQEVQGLHLDVSRDSWNATSLIVRVLCWSRTWFEIEISLTFSLISMGLLFQKVWLILMYMFTNNNKHNNNSNKINL